MTTTRHHSVETREKILRVAERMFPERGYDGTSVRDITTEAGCNVASVNYHFGGKDGLYVETFRHLLQQLRERRIETIRTGMEAAGDSASLEMFLQLFADSFLEPLMVEGRGRMLMTFMDREMQNAHLPREVFFGELIRPLMAYTSEVLQQVAGPMHGLTARMCLMSLVGQLVHILKAQQVFSDGIGIEMVPHDLRDHVRHFVRFSAAGVRAVAAVDAGGLTEIEKES